MTSSVTDVGKLYPFPNACSSEFPYTLVLSVQQAQFVVQLMTPVAADYPLSGVMTPNVTTVQLGAAAAVCSGQCAAGRLAVAASQAGPYEVLQFAGVLTDTCVWLAANATLTDSSSGLTWEATYVLSGRVQ